MTRTHDRGQRRGAWSSPHGRAHGGSRCPRDGPLSTAPVAAGGGARSRLHRPRRWSWCGTTATRTRRRPGMRRAFRPRPGGSWRVGRVITPPGPGVGGRGPRPHSGSWPGHVWPGGCLTRPPCTRRSPPGHRDAIRPRAPLIGGSRHRRPASSCSDSTRQCSAVKALGLFLSRKLIGFTEILRTM